MAKKSRRACQRHRGLAGFDVGFQEKDKSQPHGQGAFAGITDKGNSGQVLATGAQDIGGADIAGTDRADIDTGRLGRNIAEGDRTEQIAADQGKRVNGDIRHRVS